MTSKSESNHTPLHSEAVNNGAFHRERSEFHKEQIRTRLATLGFSEHARIKLQSTTPQATPLAFVTGVNAERFDPEKHLMTPTKSAVAVGNDQYLLNQAAAFTVALLKESNHEIVMQVKPDAVEKVQKIFANIPGNERLHIIPVPTDDKSLTSKFYQMASGISEKKPIARVDLALYESFAAGLDQPFKPIYAEEPEIVATAVAKRATFYHRMCLIAYDLMANNDQDSLRVLSLTALAARRVGGNLLADAAHKQISTNYIETLANELNFHLPEKPVYCVEVAPGIVDNGIYDNPNARQATVERAMINKFSFNQSAACSDSIYDLPKLSPMDIGKVAVQYLTHGIGEDFHDTLPKHIQELAQAGRDKETLDALKQELVLMKGNGGLNISNDLPSWALTPGTSIGRFSPLTRGYQFVPVCPLGQNF